VRVSKAKERGPQRLGRVLADYLRRAGLHEVEEARELASAWRASVSPKVLEGTRLVRVRNGVVHVAVNSSALLFELTGFRREEILTRLRSSYEGGYVRDLRFMLDSTRNDSEDSSNGD